MARIPVVVANWKMNKVEQEATLLARDVRGRLQGYDGVEVGLCVPYPFLHQVGLVLGGSRIGLGAQNVHWAEEGAYTGEVSAAMLASVGVRYVIVGHSERRRYFAEDDDIIKKKLERVVSHGMVPILCVGESLQERESGRAEEVVHAQLNGALSGFDAAVLQNPIVAYEPVWAIGTGVAASPTDAQQMHAFIRQWFRKRFGGEFADALRIQYGGSVKPDNAAALALQSDIDGALVGGASLDASHFCSIVSKFKTAKEG
ncbi:MAG: triose-phosphate isomerase [Planctomycetota bacterium]|nr:MAG: triose-phosphate isomerase [Planctomycetota bacterium]